MSVHTFTPFEVTVTCNFESGSFFYLVEEGEWA
jgi:hypothetical protein